ncbi:MAG: hypothetical protein ACMXYC_03860 [Candidatus Woesearchaeota archaeon]
MSVDFGSLDPTRETKQDLPVIYIGSDESLKGDTFGGMTFGAVLLYPQQREQLTRMGITDSKKISDTAIPLLANKIREVTSFTHVISLLPQQYNEYTLTGLLNRYHQEVADALIARFTDTRYRIEHVVDKFPGCVVGNIIIPKAESVYVEVAAASILARQAALEQREYLSKQAGFLLPLGSTHVQEALEKVLRTQKDPNKFVKLHFKNVQKALQHL